MFPTVSISYTSSILKSSILLLFLTLSLSTLLTSPSLSLQTGYVSTLNLPSLSSQICSQKYSLPPSSPSFLQCEKIITSSSINLTCTPQILAHQVCKEDCQEYVEESDRRECGKKCKGMYEELTECMYKVVDYDVKKYGGF
mmetsp:Transcript_19744/g.36748  ORF Transcript_19744/g.36748 Transcript_19744/m.36748 type:complete len:141 (+) Transcript_19744:403-825(+)